MPRLALLSLIGAAAFAQVGQNTAPGDTPSFSSTTQLVVQSVTVKDKDGKPIRGLSAKDFTITEDGVPQQIRLFEFQNLDAPALPEPVPPTLHITPFARLTRTHIAPESPGDVRYRDKRLIALYFDLTGMPMPDQIRAFNAAKTFVRTQMT